MPPIHTGEYDAPPRHPINVTTRRSGYQLTAYNRIKLVELKSIGWSYKEIHDRYPYIPINTIKTT